ncbi:conserved hypothetical protein [Ricinus communis]|uniref:Uncharacterized protein n=1 Tax=Ricinus communis TaxID=3988 RepID=B9TEY3_RICCO|nr:conserved hypothetical protein [Ricinus communis]
MRSGGGAVVLRCGPGGGIYMTVGPNYTILKTGNRFAAAETRVDWGEKILKNNL